MAWSDISVYNLLSFTCFTCAVSCFCSILGSCSDLMKVRISTLHTSLNSLFHFASIFLLLCFSSAGCSYAGDSSYGPAERHRWRRQGESVAPPLHKVQVKRVLGSIGIAFNRLLWLLIVLSMVNSAEEGAESTAKCYIFICSSCRGQLLLRNFTPKTLAGPKGSSRPLKLWAGAPRSCCTCQCKHLCHLCFSNGSLNSSLL